MFDSPPTGGSFHPSFDILLKSTAGHTPAHCCAYLFDSSESESDEELLEPRSGDAFGGGAARGVSTIADFTVTASPVPVPHYKHEESTRIYAVRVQLAWLRAIGRFLVIHRSVVDRQAAAAALEPALKIPRLVRPTWSSLGSGPIIFAPGLNPLATPFLPIIATVGVVTEASAAAAAPAEQMGEQMMCDDVECAAFLDGIFDTNIDKSAEAKALSPASPSSGVNTAAGCLSSASISAGGPGAAGFFSAAASCGAGGVSGDACVARRS